MAGADAHLVGRTLQGDKHAFSELVRRHQGRIVAAARHLVGEDEAAFDVAQESFIEAYRGLGNLQDPERFGGWLYGILRIRCRRYLSRRPPRALSLEADPVPEPSIPPFDPAASDLTPLLDRLRQDDREILAARYLMDMSYEQIATMLGVAAGTVRVRCFRARQALRGILQAEGDADAVAEGGGR